MSPLGPPGRTFAVVFPLNLRKKCYPGTGSPTAIEQLTSLERTEETQYFLLVHWLCSEHTTS